MTISLFDIIYLSIASIVKDIFRLHFILQTVRHRHAGSVPGYMDVDVLLVGRGLKLYLTRFTGGITMYSSNKYTLVPTVPISIYME